MKRLIELVKVLAVAAVLPAEAVVDHRRNKRTTDGWSNN